MLSERRLIPSTACRITLEQVAHQSGFRLPYVPFVGLGIESRPCFRGQWSNALQVYT